MPVPRALVIWLVAAVVVVVVAAGGARAHEQSRGVSTFAIDDRGGVAIRIEMNSLDLVDWIGAPLPPPDDLTAHDKVQTALRLLVPRSLRIAGDAQRCDVELQRFERIGSIDLALIAVARCGRVPETLRIDWGLFAGTPLDHVSIARVTAPGGIAHATSFSRRNPKLEVLVQRPAASTAALRAVRASSQRLVGEPWFLVVTGLAGVLAARVRRALVVAAAVAAAYVLGLLLARQGAPRPSPALLQMSLVAATAVTAGLGVAARTVPLVARGRTALAVTVALITGALVGMAHEPVFDAVLSSPASPLLCYAALTAMIAAGALVLAAAGAVVGRRTEQRVTRP